MYDHAYIILGIVVAVFLIAKALRLSTELSMLAIISAGSPGAVYIIAKHKSETSNAVISDIKSLFNNKTYFIIYHYFTSPYYL